MEGDMTPERPLGADAMPMSVDGPWPVALPVDPSGTRTAETGDIAGAFAQAHKVVEARFVKQVLLPLAEQRRFIESFKAVSPECGFLHYSYCATSPLSTRKLGLAARRLAWTPLNFPPASVWHYRHVPG
jgi:hypothetical protein